MKKAQKTWIVRGIAVGMLTILIGAVAAFGQIDNPEQPEDHESYDPFLVAIQVLGITEEVLNSQLEEGNSIAQVARNLGFEPDSIVQAIRQAEAVEIDAILALGDIDEDEASEWRDLSFVFAVESVYLPPEVMLWDEVGEFSEFVGFGESGEFVGFGEFAEFEVFADYYGFEDEAYTLFPYAMAIETQRSIAYSLLDSNVEPRIVVDAVLESEMPLIEQILDFIVGLFIFDAGDDAYVYGDDSWEDDIINIVAEKLGVDEDAIWTTLDGGQTLASLAQSHSVDPQILIDLLMVEEEEWIAGLLADGDLTESEATEWRASSLKMIEEFINEPWF